VSMGLVNGSGTTHFTYFETCFAERNSWYNTQCTQPTFTTILESGQFWTRVITLVQRHIVEEHDVTGEICTKCNGPGHGS
jgi:hypothetical protein